MTIEAEQQAFQTTRGDLLNRAALLEKQLTIALKALRRIDAMDWGWKGGGSEVRVPGKYAQVARSVLSELEKSE